MNKPTVLIAEDNPGLAKVLSFKFRASGFDVTTTPDGQTAWEAFQRNPTSAVVSDQEMPHKTGVELCRSIREIDKSVPLFLVTGRQMELSTTGVSDELKLSGMFAKPFSPAAIVAEVNRAIAILQDDSQPPAAAPTPAAPIMSATTINTATA